LSLSLHWSDVLPDLLESLEQEKSQMSEVHEALACYRQEPYRLKLSYQSGWKTRDRNRNARLYNNDLQKTGNTRKQF